MIRSGAGRAAKGVLASAGVIFMVAACATVSPDEMDQELERVRAEMREEFRQADQEVEERLGDRVTEVESRMSSLESELDQLREEFDVTVERMEGAIRFNAPVHFAFDDAAVRTEDREVLEQFARVVQDYYEGVTITVEGFTDPAGSPEYNRRLGQERAESVVSFLAGQGLAADQLRAVSYGQDPERQIVPGAQGPGTDGWQNRRVSMVIDFHPGAQRMPVTANRIDG